MSLHLVVGCMFSGKSSELIRIVRRLDTISENYIVIKPKIEAIRSETIERTTVIKPPSSREGP